MKDKIKGHKSSNYFNDILFIGIILIICILTYFLGKEISNYVKYIIIFLFTVCLTLIMIGVYLYYKFIKRGKSTMGKIISIKEDSNSKLYTEYIVKVKLDNGKILSRKMNNGSIDINKTKVGDIADILVYKNEFIFNNKYYSKLDNKGNK